MTTKTLRETMQEAARILTTNEDVDSRDAVDAGVALSEAADRVLTGIAATLVESADLIESLAGGRSDRAVLVADRMRQLSQTLAPPRLEPQEYYVLHKVTWQPTSDAPDDVIMDFQHSLEVADPRFLTYGMEAIGDLKVIAEYAAQID